MGFLDKAAAKVGEATKAAQEGIAEQTAKRKADALLRELGAWTYAKHKGGFDDADANIARVLGELAAHEAEHGELGAKGSRSRSRRPRPRPGLLRPPRRPSTPGRAGPAPATGRGGGSTAAACPAPEPPPAPPVPPAPEPPPAPPVPPAPEPAAAACARAAACSACRLRPSPPLRLHPRRLRPPRSACTPAAARPAGANPGAG